MPQKSKKNIKKNIRKTRKNNGGDKTHTPSIDIGDIKLVVDSTPKSSRSTRSARSAKKKSKSSTRSARSLNLNAKKIQSKIRKFLKRKKEEDEIMKIGATPEFKYKPNSKIRVLKEQIENLKKERIHLQKEYEKK